MQLPVLNFPSGSFRIAETGGGQSSKIFDIVRRKFVRLTPEEWVRQHLLHFLVTHRHIPRGLIAVEKKVSVNGLPRRTDVLVYGRSKNRLLLAECKSPDVKITQRAFDQAARYNMSLDVDYFVLTNGLKTYCCMPDHQKQAYTFLKDIPDLAL